MELFECFEGDLSYSSDTVYSFDFDFVLEDDVCELTENFVEDLLHSGYAVHSLDFDFGMKEVFLNYSKLSKKAYYILVSQYIHLISTLELKKIF